MTATDPKVGDAASIVPFVPRLTIEWLRDQPEQLGREVEGTLAFVDISGFTAMSERLASLGKAGAEEVTGIMNAVFAALLEEAYAYGGGLLKFGGDALLLLFEGDGHAPRAAAASHAMRRTLRAIGRPRTSAGTVTLKMHVGLHSGTIHFFLVGGSHRELIVTGPGATRTVEMESASEAGDVLLSPESAALVEPRALGEPKEGGVLLRAAPAAERSRRDLPEVTGLPLADAVPRSVRAELLEGPLEGEHRHAAIAFVRFTGIDALLARERLDTAAATVEALVRSVQEAADRNDVTFLESDVDRDGGRIVLVAGAPQTADDDDERLLRTVRAVVDARPPLPVHVGVSRGRVFAGQVGAAFRRTYTVLGGTAATAARLMARAGENEILVAADVLERAGGQFEATELESFRVKGKSEPLRASALGPLRTAAQQPAAPRARRLPFVDRERERAVLGASVAPVRSGLGILVELIGEPGIGKSRLAEELRELGADMQLVVLGCDRYGSTTPYAPFRDVLRGLLGVELDGEPEANTAAVSARLAELDPELAPWAPLLSAPLDVEFASTPQVDDLDPSFRRARLHGVVGTALGRLLDAPTLVLVEDVHWMDEPSSELLRHLGTQLQLRPWLICTTRRPGDGGFLAAEGTPPLPAFTLRLEPLPAADARTLVAAAAEGSRPLSEEELEAIAERGGGNPLFLQELASAPETSADEGELPENVEALVASRIDSLAPPDRALLRWASVLGVSFSGELVAEVLADDPSAASDSEAWDRLGEFVGRDPAVAGAFRFRHALIRDAAYDGLSFRRRRELHALVAEAIERRAGEDVDEESELLSLHAFLGGRSLQAWTHSVVAGRRAQAKWANVEAAEFYRRALESAAEVRELPVADVAAVWEALADCLQLSGRLGEAGRALAEARRRRPKATPEHVVLMRKEGELREELGRYSDALRWYGRGLKEAATLSDAGERKHHELRLRLAQAQIRARQGIFPEAIRGAAAVATEALEVDDRETLAPAYVLLHVVHALLGAPERNAFRGLALPLYEELGDLSGQAAVLANLGVEAYQEGEWDKALDLYERSRTLRERLGDVPKVGRQLSNVGEICSDRGDFADAELLFEEAQRIADAAGQPKEATVALANLGRVAARTGRFDDAERLLGEALARFTELHAGSYVLEAQARLAEVAVLRGDRPQEALDRAAAVLEQLAGSADVPGLHALVLRLTAAARLQLGEREAGLAALREGLELAGGADVLYELALGLDLLAHVTQDADVRRDAEALLARLGVHTTPPLPLGD